MNAKESSTLRSKLKLELGLQVKDQHLNKYYDAGLPSYTLVYNDTVYFGHTKDEVIEKVLREMKGETNDESG